jgi:hypothetical protein
MRAHNFGLVTLGKGGPGTDAEGNPAQTTRGARLNSTTLRDQVRAGHVSPPVRTTLKTYPEGSVGLGYQGAMDIRKAARLSKGVVWTKEQEKRDGWPRARKWLEPKFADCDPSTSTLHDRLRSE